LKERNQEIYPSRAYSKTILYKQQREREREREQGGITCWCSGRGKTSPKIVTLAFDKPLHPGIYET
jgi:hypothetical protein